MMQVFGERIHLIKESKSKNMKFSILYALLISILIFSCKKDDDADPVNMPAPKTSTLNLSDIQAGQMSQFVEYEGLCGTDSDRFSYTGDTINLKVIEFDSKLLFEETYTQFSKSVVNGTQNTDPVTYEVYPHDNYFLIPERMVSKLFFFYGNDTVLTAPNNKIQLHQETCILADKNSSPFIGDDVGYFVHFNVGPIELENKTAVSCVPGFMDLEAYLIHDGETLFMSHRLSPLGITNEKKVYEGWVALNRPI